MALQYSSNDASLATEATEFYNHSQLGSCLSHMKKLYSTKSTDPKVIANKALVEFIHQNNLTHSDEYLEQLRKAASLVGLPISPSMKLSDHILSLTSPSELDPSVFSIHYNYALVLFHQRRFGLANRLLSTLLGISEPDATPNCLHFPIKAGLLISQRCLLLWLDVCLALYHYQRVFEYTSYFIQQIKLPEGESSLNLVILEMLKEISRPLRIFRLRACLQTGRLNEAQGEIAILDETEDHPEAKKRWDVSRSLEYARAQLQYLKLNQNAAIESLTNLLSPKKNPTESPLIQNNLALAFFSSRRGGLAILQSRSALRSTEQLSSENTANEMEDLLRRTPLKTLSASRHIELLHNMGLELLLQKKSPEAAFHFLLPVVEVYPRNPRLWLRLAECCILVHRSSNLVDWRAESRSSCLQKVVGSGPMRKLIIGNQGAPAKLQQSGKDTSVPPNGTSPTMEFAAQCIRNAYLLLPRPPAELVDSSPEKEGIGAILKWASDQSCPVRPSSQDLSGEALLQVISAVLVTGAYIFLCLDDPVEVIHYAEQLLSDGPPKSSDNSFGWLGQFAPPAYRYLAKMYLAEARIAMDEITEALDSLLLPDRFTSKARGLVPNTLRLPFASLNVTSCLSTSQFLPQTCLASELPLTLSTHSKELNFPLNNIQASGIVLHNMAVCFMLKGEQTESRSLLERSSTSLLVNINETNSPSNIQDGSEENRLLLYPPENLMDSISSLLVSHQFPKQFLRNWVYLEMKSGRPKFAAHFLRAHIGNEAFGNTIAQGYVSGRSAGKERTSPLIALDTGSSGLRDLERRQLTRHLSINQLNDVVRVQPMPLRIRDPPPPSAPSEAPGLKWCEADWPPL
nr:CCR4 NOT transcription complex subunit 10 [Hymenolepis microstoma]